MQDIVFSFDFFILTTIFCFVFPIYYWVVNKQIYAWFDPFLIFVFFNSISVSFVIYMYFFLQSIKLMYFVSFSLCVFGFMMGILFGGKKGLPKWEQKFREKKIINYSQNYFLLIDVFMTIALLIMLSSNIFMLFVKGTLPIFTSNPSEAKITLYTGGWGLVKRINFSLVNYVLAIPLIKLLHPKIQLTNQKKIYYFSCLFLCILVLLSMGSKASLLVLLNILFSLFIINKTYGISINDKITPLKNIGLIRKYAKKTFIAAVFFMFVVIVLSGVETSSTDTLITRLVSSGDVFYFFYVFDIIEDFHFTAIDYIPHFFNPLLGMFRLADYEYGLGIYSLHYAANFPLDADAAFGPNAQHPIEGLVYFGKYGGALYSFFVGSIVSYIRVGFLRKLGPYPNFFSLVIYVVFSSLVINMCTDVPLFIQMFFDHIIFGFIILMFSLVLTTVIKKVK
jgi:hypothetical protein